ncbi:hypothetical protein Tco_1351875 [Tanacetum coccineum]
MAKRAQPVLYDADTLLHPNHHPCISTHSRASYAIFEINKLRQQLQGKDDTIRNLDAQINIMKVLNVGSTEALKPKRGLVQSSGPSTSETPKVLAPGMYNLGSKSKNHFWSQQKLGLRRALGNHSSLPVKSANARRVEAHHRTLNKKNRVDSNLLVKHSVSVSNLNNVCGACNKSLVFANHTDCLVMCDGSVNVKPHQTKRFKRQPKKEWKPIKRVWQPISKPIANSKPQWKPWKLVPKGSLVLQFVLWSSCILLARYASTMLGIEETAAAN